MRHRNKLRLLVVACVLGHALAERVMAETPVRSAAEPAHPQEFALHQVVQHNLYAYIPPQCYKR